MQPAPAAHPQAAVITRQQRHHRELGQRRAALHADATGRTEAVQAIAGRDPVAVIDGRRHLDHVKLREVAACGPGTAPVGHLHQSKAVDVDQHAVVVVPQQPRSQAAAIGVVQRVDITEPAPVEAHRAFPGRDPQEAVVVLADGVHLAMRQAVVGVPAGDGIALGRQLGIQRLRRTRDRSQAKGQPRASGQPGSPA